MCIKEDYNVGIDLGTTYSCLAYIDDKGDPIIEKNFEQEETTPSVILFNEDREIIVGSPAKDMAAMYPSERTFVSVKRYIGTDYEVDVDGETYTPVTLSASILRKILGDFNEAHDYEVKRAVITCPAYFGQNERDSTRNAGIIAGLEDVIIINEPTAAAISFGYGTDGSKKRVLVYDLGGGTFDVTILDIDGSTFNAVATDGVRLLGGRDWDVALSSLILEKVSQLSGVLVEDLENNENAVLTLDIDTESIKKRLTTAESTRGSMTVNGERILYKVTRDEFEAVTVSLFDRTMAVIDDVLRSKDFTIEDIDDIILVGGSCKMPHIKEGIKKEYPNTSVQLFDPDRSVARGAALFARSESLKETEASEHSVDVKNVLSKTFGVKVDYNGKDLISNLIYRNEPLPMENVKVYYPLEDGQESVQIQIFENSTLRSDNEPRTEIDDGTYVGAFVMELPEGVVMNTPVTVRFMAAEDGTISAEAECMDEIKEYDLESLLSLSEADLEKSRGLIEKVRN